MQQPAGFGAWENFYVIIGSSAAALTGLQFVVVALGAQANLLSRTATRAFGTPTIVHLCSTLVISAVLSAPWEAASRAALVLAFVGAAGIVYLVRVFFHVRNQADYVPVLEDWIWHFALPWGVYAALFVSAVVLPRHTPTALFWIAGVALALLLIGIHNAWDSATYIAVDRPRNDDAGRTDQAAEGTKER